MSGVWVLKVRFRTASPLVSGEIDERRRKEMKLDREVHIPLRLAGNGKVAVTLPVRAALERLFKETPKDVLKKKFGIENDRLLDVCDTGKSGAMGCGKCILCDMFGYISKGGGKIARIRRSDFYSVEPYEKIARKTYHSKISRETETVESSMTIEEVKEGAEFEGEFIIRDPKESDVKMLIAALEYIRQNLGVGGWKSRGRGFIESYDVELKKLSMEDLLKEAEKKWEKVL